MKIVKLVVCFLIILCGVFASYLTFLAFETQGWATIGMYLSISLILLCFGIVSLLLTISKNPLEKNRDKKETNPHKPISIDPINPTQDEFASMNPADSATDTIAPVTDVNIEPIDIKEDPTFLFGDWWVDQDGLYIDLRLIKITGSKQQRILRNLKLKTKLDYHLNDSKDTIEVLYDNVVLGLVPEIYLHSILMYSQGIDQFYAESIEKKGRNVVQFIVRVRFNEDLREKLQKKLQQKNWQ